MHVIDKSLGTLGIEPRPTGLEAAMLPLHHAPHLISYKRYIHIFHSICTWVHQPTTSIGTETLDNPGYANVSSIDKPHRDYKGCVKITQLGNNQVHVVFGKYAPASRNIRKS